MNLWRRVEHAVTWTRPTSVEVGSVVKSGLAAGLAWWLATIVTDEPYPVLASLTAVVVVQVSLKGSVRTALQRSAAVAGGVTIALAIGESLELDGVVVALVVAGSLAVAELLLRLPPASARQVPVTTLVVLSAVSLNPRSSGWQRLTETLAGALVGVAVSIVLPVSHALNARQALQRLADGLSDSLTTMGTGLQHRWSTEQTEQWRRTARTVRGRLVHEATEAIQDGLESVRWNARDRRHAALLDRLDAVMPRLERAAIGVSVIARGLDDHARLTGSSHRAMASLGRLLSALADSVHVVALGIVSGAGEEYVGASLDNVRVQRARCVRGASRRARDAIEHGDESDVGELEGEWLSYAALLVQVDRILADLSAPLPS